MGLSYCGIRHGRLLDENTNSVTVEQMFQRRLITFALSERQLVSYVLKGLPNQEIARLCAINEQSVKNALSMLYRKLNIFSRSQLFHLVFPI